MMPLLGLSLYLSISASLAVAALYLVKWGLEFRTPKRTPWTPSALDIPILVLFIWTALSAVVTGSESFFHAVSSQSAFLLFYWAAHGCKKEKVPMLMTWLGIGAMVAGIWGVLQMLGGFNYLQTTHVYDVPPFAKQLPERLVHYFSLRDSRSVGPRSHPLTYAECFIPAFFLLLSALVQEWGKNKKPSPHFLGVAFALLMVGLGALFAEGRGVWLGLGLGVFVFGWAMGRQFFFRISLLAVLLFGILFAASPSVRGRFLSIFSSSSGSISDQQSKDIRRGLWRESFKEIRAHPVIGVGYRGAKLHTIDPVTGLDRVWTETHNMFLQAGVELGLVGLGIFLWVLVAGWTVVRASAPPWRAAFLGMFVAFCVAGLTESWTHDKEVAMLFWVMMGSAAALKNNESK